MVYAIMLRVKSLNKEDTTMTKKIYNQPEVLVARIALESMVLAGSPVAPAGDQMPIGDGDTDIQW